jgi:hypothetical protein
MMPEERAKVALCWDSLLFGLIHLCQALEWKLMGVDEKSVRQQVACAKIYFLEGVN